MFYIYIWLACVKYIASVHPEPGSNSLYGTKNKKMFNLKYSFLKNKKLNYNIIYN